MPSEIGVALFGAGWIGDWYCKIFSRMAGVNLRVLVDTDPRLAEKCAQKFNIDRWCTDYQEALKMADLDTVIIATPPRLHPEMVTRALKVGKNIICEKPIAADWEGAMQIREAVHKSPCVFIVDYMERFNLAYREAKEYIDEGGIGKVVFMRSNFRVHKGRFLERGPEHWLLHTEDGGGPIKESLVHDFDIMRWFLGCEVKRVYAESATSVLNEELENVSCEDTAAIVLRFEDGTLGIVDGSWGMPETGHPYADNRMEIVGTKGAIFLNFNGEPVTFATDKEGVVYPEPLRQSELAGAYRVAFEHFIECIRRGKVIPPATTVEDGCITFQIALAAIESAKKRKPVELSSDQKNPII